MSETTLAAAIEEAAEQIWAAFNDRPTLMFGGGIQRHKERMAVVIYAGLQAVAEAARAEATRPADAFRLATPPPSPPERRMMGVIEIPEDD